MGKHVEFTFDKDVQPENSPEPFKVICPDPTREAIRNRLDPPLDDDLESTDQRVPRPKPPPSFLGSMKLEEPIIEE